MPAFCFASSYAGKVMDHAEYPRRCRRRSDAELLFVIADARAAHDANPDNPNAGYYLDEINYCADELNRRRKGGRRELPQAQPVAVDPDALILDAVQTAYRLAADGTIDPAYVANAYAMAGQPMADDELAELAAMTPDELADQIQYLADYQG